MSESLPKPGRAFNKIAAYGLLLQEDKYLLLLRQNTGYQDGKFGLPAGHLEPGELITEALAREVKEEIGVDIDIPSVRFVHAAHRPENSYVDFFFEVPKWVGEVTSIESEKCSELSWHDPLKLPENTIPFVRLVINDIANDVSYSEYPDEPK